LYEAGNEVGEERGGEFLISVWVQAGEALDEVCVIAAEDGVG